MNFSMCLFLLDLSNDLLVDRSIDRSSDKLLIDCRLRALENNTASSMTTSYRGVSNPGFATLGEEAQQVGLPGLGDVEQKRDSSSLIKYVVS